MVSVRSPVPEVVPILPDIGKGHFNIDEHPFLNPHGGSNHQIIYRSSFITSTINHVRAQPILFTCYGRAQEIIQTGQSKVYTGR